MAFFQSTEGTFGSINNIDFAIAFIISLANQIGVCARFREEYAAAVTSIKTIVLAVCHISTYLTSFAENSNSLHRRNSGE